jgi:NAD-dependent SIR2 family protein deacetylase
MKCKKHNWANLFNGPTADASRETKEKWAVMVMFDDAGRLKVCSCCGVIGTTSRGRAKGGNTVVKPAFRLYGDPHTDRFALEDIAKINAQAKKWNEGL